VDEDDYGGFGLDLGVDDEGLDGAVAVFDGNVLVMAGRGFEAGLGPVLCLQTGSGEGKEKESEEVLNWSAHGRSVVCGGSLDKAAEVKFWSGLRVGNFRIDRHWTG